METNGPENPYGAWCPACKQFLWDPWPAEPRTCGTCFTSCEPRLLALMSDARIAEILEESLEGSIQPRAVVELAVQRLKGVPRQLEEERRFEKAVCLDFDGVVHLYEQPWTYADEVRDGPVKDAIPAIAAYLEAGIKVYIQSVRAAGPGGRVAIESWLLLHGAREHWLFDGLVQVVSEKPKALMYVDDRGFRFEGRFPTPAEVLEARPWNRPRKS